MKAAETLPVDRAPSRPPPGANLTRRLYAAAAVAIGVVMFLGFQQFYLHGKAAGGRPVPPPLLKPVIAHGVTMTLWVILLIVQSFLVTARKVALHRTLGSLGAVLAVAVFGFGVWLAITAVQLAPPEVELWDLPIRRFLAVPLLSIATFAGLVAAGVVFRKRPDLHRPLMFCATLVAIPAAADRYQPIVSLYRDNLMGRAFGPFAFAVGFGLVFLVLHSAVRRKFDAPFAICWGIVALVGAGTMALARTPAWDAIASFLLGQPPQG